MPTNKSNNIIIKGAFDFFFSSTISVFLACGAGAGGGVVGLGVSTFGGGGGGTEAAGGVAVMGRFKTSITS